MVKVKSRKNIVIVGLIAVGFLIAGGVPGLMTFLDDLDVEVVGVSYEYRDVLGGSAAEGWADILGPDSFITSWASGGASELIVLTGYYKGAFGYDITPAFTHYWYEVTLEVNNPDVKINGVTATTWRSPDYEEIFLDNYEWTPCQTAQLTITNPCYGKIHVELWGNVNDLNPFSDNVGLLAEDEAHLRDGIGRVIVQDTVVEEGEYADFYVTTGYATTDRTDVPVIKEGWTLMVFNPSGTEVFRQGIADNFKGTVSWLVPAGSYKTTWDNIHVVTLRNELIEQDDDWFVTVGVGMSDDVPGTPTFEIISGDPPFTPGESITVRVSSERVVNEIDGFWVWVSYETSAGATTEYIYLKKWYEGTQTSTGAYADVSFTFPSVGNVRMEAMAMDSIKLNSDMGELAWTIYGPSGDDDVLADINWVYVAIGAIVLIGAMAIYKQVPKPYNIVVLLALVALGAYLILLGLGEI